MNSELAGHTLKAHDQHLTQLLEMILRMGDCVRTLIETSKVALGERSEPLVERARKEDEEINRLEAALDEAATATLALQSPVAVDLRFVTSALKISGMLERAGDLAKNNVKRSQKLGKYASDEIMAQLAQMADINLSMLEDALRAVQERNPDLANAVWKRDDEVDDLYHAIFSTMQKVMQKDKKNIEACTHIVFMAKNLERMADYITNMAKTVHYVATGAHVTKAALKSG